MPAIDSSSGHAAHDLVALGQPVDGAEPARGVGHHRQTFHRTPEARHELQRIVAGDHEAGVRLGRRFVAGRLTGKPDGDRRRGDSGGKALVVGRQLRGLADERRELGLFGKQLGKFAGRQTVRLGEDEIDRYGTGAVRLQAVDDLGEARTRPRPLPDAGERSIVDIDDAHGKRRIDRARGKIEIGVEHGKPQPRHRLRVGDAQGNRHEEQHRRKQDVDGERAQGRRPHGAAPFAPRTDHNAGGSPCTIGVVLLPGNFGHPVGAALGELRCPLLHDEEMAAAGVLLER